MNAALVDTGPLVAYLHRRDRFHGWAVEQFKHQPFPLLTCEAVLTEACHLVRKLVGGCSLIMKLLEEKVVANGFELAEETQAVSALMTRYQRVPMSLADACLVRMAELRDRANILTIDSDFVFYRKHGRKVIPTIMPDLSKENES
ncbi:MAG: type II toxin-antitoxin system VapC family toxin [Gemmataceae bacterium]